jgi:hypothetical protein
LRLWIVLVDVEVLLKQYDQNCKSKIDDISDEYEIMYDTRLYQSSFPKIVFCATHSRSVVQQHLAILEVSQTSTKTDLLPQRA